MSAKRRAVAPVSPLNFRMPRELRARLRTFAEARSLGESDALRLIVSEYLDESVTARELELAERWQFKQAYATFKRDIAGKEKTVPWSEIERVFTDALAKRRPGRR
jgi:predicted DNA-binding protein